MAEVKISKDRLSAFLAAVSGDYAVWGPTAKDGVVAFGGIRSADELMLGYRNSTISAKELFLPRAETVYEFDGENYVEDAIPDQERVVFGMRPCDCRALALLDRTFDGERVKDPFYVARRANTVVVALACARPLSTCFCTSVGGGPYGEEGADVLMDDEGDSLPAKALTRKGQDFLARYGEFFSAGASREWAARAKQAAGRMESNLQIEGIESRLGGLFEDDIWEAASRKCLGCGTCSYLCPVCYCFDLVDEKTPTGARKVRRWDCCMFPLFTLHASGHNPRPVNAARLRQKVMHKFSYHTERCGASGCVGCGRCIRSCPVNLDIRQLLEEVAASARPAAQK